MSCKRFFVVGLLVCGLAAVATADWIPEGCQGNSLTIQILRPEPLMHIGETIEYTVIVSNPNGFQCQKTDVSVYCYPVNTNEPDDCRVPDANAVLLGSGITLNPGESMNWDSNDFASLA